MSTISTFFNIALGGTFGFMFANAIIAIFSIITCYIGYKLLIEYNKPGTKIFKEMTFGQYLGIFIIIIGLSPYIQYFIISLMMNGGNYAFSEIVSNFELE